MASKEQAELMKGWYGHTGFEFMGIDDVRATDPQGFIEAWTHNVDWLRDVATEAEGMINEYKNRNDQ